MTFGLIFKIAKFSDLWNVLFYLRFVEKIQSGAFIVKYYSCIQFNIYGKYDAVQFLSVKYFPLF